MNEINNLLKQELEPIDKQLDELGLPSTLELCTSKVNYKAAIPILLNGLFSVGSYRAKDILISLLSVSWSKPTAAKPLITALRLTNKGQPFEGLTWEICNALDFAANDSVADDLFTVANDKAHGRKRIMAVSAVGRLRDPRAVEVLIGLLSDPDVLLGAIDGLMKLAPREARPHLVPLLKHEEAWVRRQAQKAIDRIDKKHPALNHSLGETQRQVNAVALEQPLASGLEGTSTSCDFEDLEPLLIDLAGLVSTGFGKVEIAQVLNGVQELDDADGSVCYDFPIEYDGEHTVIRVSVRMKNGEPDVYLYALPRLIVAFAPMIRERD